MRKLYYLLMISLVLGCVSFHNNSKLYDTDDRDVLLVKSLVDTIFQKEKLLNRYLKFNETDTIYIKIDTTLGVNKKWNKLTDKEKYKIVIVDTTNKHYFKFLKLKIQKNTFEIEMISESTGNMINGKAKLRGHTWDLKGINSGIR
jgi:2C-methyl-D-erythritol 2,4-cyclodiphosphate synthase